MDTGMAITGMVDFELWLYTGRVEGAYLCAARTRLRTRWDL